MISLVSVLVEVAGLLDLIRLSFVEFLGYFSFVLSLRFSLFWFPNINPYIQPTGF